MFAPQPPKANAGVTADARAAERITTPSNGAESFFMKNLLALTPPPNTAIAV
jgi:hypothetical protein